MSLSARLLASCAALVTITAAPALAADYDPPIHIEEAPEWVPVEIGNGWYLRGDVTYSVNRGFMDTALRIDRTIFDNNIIDNLVGLPQNSPLNVFGLSAKRVPVSGSIGFGYHFNDFLRAEVNLGMFANDSYGGSGFLNAGPAGIGCIGTRTTTTTNFDADGEQIGVPTIEVDPNAREGCGVSASLRNAAWTGTLNAYADLGTVAGFTPYVGAGAGLLYTRTKFSVEAQCAAHDVTTTTAGGDAIQRDTFLCRGQGSPNDEPVTYNPINVSHTDYSFLYSLSAGFAYQLTQNTKLDVGYQYVNAPKLRGFDYHQVKVGLRYSLW